VTYPFQFGRVCDAACRDLRYPLILDVFWLASGHCLFSCGSISFSYLNCNKGNVTTETYSSSRHTPD
jgi:sulfite exporter TauE/SafE